MKNNIIISVIVIILCVAGYALFDEKKSETPVVPLASAQITVLERTVLAGVDKESLKEIKASSTEVTVDSYLKTDHKGRALIELGKAQTIVDYSSEVTVADMTNKGSSIYLFLGTTWSRVEKLFDKGEYYEIKTKNTVASVRGTSFGIYYLLDATQLVVATGTVAFSALDKEGNIIASSTIYVSGGEEASRKGLGPIIKSPMTEKTKKDLWYIYNNSDKKTEENKPAPIPVVPKKPVTQGQEASASQNQNAATTSNSTSNSNAQIDIDYRFSIYSVGSVSINEGVDTEVTIKGVGFSQLIAVRLDDEIKFSIIDDNEIVIILPVDIHEGVYDLQLMGEGGRTIVTKDAITVMKRGSR